MRNIASGLAIFVVFAVLSFMLVLREKNKSADETRTPSGFADVAEAIDQIDVEIDDPKIFNALSAALYIHSFADRAYALTSRQFLPQGAGETEVFLKKADAMTKKLFHVRLRLNDRLRQFEASGAWNTSSRSAAIDAFRRAHLYLSYAEDYAIKWRNQLAPLRKGAVFFSGEGPLHLVNPSFPNPKGKQLYQAGDVILVRGASFFSATIARIGDVPTNYSHIAMVAETEAGDLRVVEALLEKSQVSYPVEEYFKFEALPRAAIYRLNDGTMARAAGRSLWKLYQQHLKKPVAFDIYMNPDDHAKVYCAELMAMAFENASKGKVKIPRYRTSFRGAVRTDFAKGVGMTSQESFAPADIVVDTRFTLVAEHRDLNLLDESLRYDVVLSKLFEKFKAGFTYKNDVPAGVEATIGFVLRKLGFKKEEIPEGISQIELMSLIRHRNLVTQLMSDLEQAQKSAGSQPLSYREIEEAFERICAGNCVERKAAQVKVP